MGSNKILKMENALTTIYDYNIERKECEKHIEEKLGTEEEFIQGKMDWEYHTEIPWGMVKIIMDLLE